MISLSKIKKPVVIPEGVTVKLNDYIEVHGKLGSVKRQIKHHGIRVTLKDNKLYFDAVKKFTKKEKCIINTLKAHIKNMFKGVTEGYVYKLKICSGHFPMNVEVEKDNVVIKNFLGERVPRVAKILEGVNVEVKGNDIIVKGIDIEKVGQTSANIERATRRPGYDRRVFQDGCYIYKKGKE